MVLTDAQIGSALDNRDDLKPKARTSSQSRPRTSQQLLLSFCSLLLTSFFLDHFFLLILRSFSYSPILSLLTFPFLLVIRSILSCPFIFISPFSCFLLFTFSHLSFSVCSLFLLFPFLSFLSFPSSLFSVLLVWPA